jgi:hypothetical protein
MSKSEHTLGEKSMIMSHHNDADYHEHERPFSHPPAFRPVVWLWRDTVLRLPCLVPSILC